MPNNRLILRTLASPWTIPNQDITKGTVLTHDDVDNNFIYLRGELIYSAQTSGQNLILNKINGADITIDLNSVVDAASGVLWTTGSTGNYSLKTINNSTVDATGNYAMAQGFNTLASGSSSVALNVLNTANGDYSVVIGSNNSVDGDYAFVGGTANQGDGNGAFVVGNSNNSQGLGGAVFGQSNNILVGANYSFAAGRSNIVADNYCFAIGNDNYVTGNQAFVSGYQSTASGDTSFIHSTNSLVTGARSVVLGGSGITGSSSDTVYVPNLNIDSTPSTDNSIDNILVRNTDGSVQLRTAASLSEDGLWTAGTGTDAVVLANSGSIASGITAVAEGTNTIAGKYSHAEGFMTKAIASDDGASHAEGIETVASGDGSHAEGIGTLASGYYTHAEGATTIASGTAAHSEGIETTAGGEGSHAEGSQSLASGQNSHAEGNGTVASGTISHAEGFGTTASGSYTHAEGQSTLASGLNSHAEGENTLASGTSSHAEGTDTTASGDYSHAEGSGTTASGSASHAGGNNSIASGSTSFIHSTNSTVTGDRSVVLGGISHIINTGTTNSAIIGGDGGTINNDISNSIILGGDGITASANDKVYTSDIIVAGTNKVSSYVGGGELNLNDPFGPDGTWSITSDKGGYGAGSTWVYAQPNNGIQTAYQMTGSEAIGFYVGPPTNPALYNAKEIVITDNSSTTASAGTTDKRAVMIGTKNSLVLPGRVNSVILGGQDITATASDTVYVSKLNIDSVPVGDPVYNLGLDASGNVVTGNTAQSFTGGTVTGDTIYTAGLSACTSGITTNDIYTCAGSGLTIHANVTYIGQANTPLHHNGSGSTFTLDFNNSNIQTITLTGNTSILNPLNVKEGASYTVIIKQGPSGPYTINSWGSNFKFESGTYPALSTGTTNVDIITFISDDESNLYGIGAYDFF